MVHISLCDEASRVTKPDISLVCTVFNDAPIVPKLVQEACLHLRAVSENFELILVNDGSMDNSREAIDAACGEFPQVKAIHLARNYGQQIAVSAGLRYASGDVVAVADGDLQNPLYELPRMYSLLKEGFDIVYTTSSVRNGPLSRWTSRLFWFILRQVLRVDIVADQLMLRMMTRRYAQLVNTYSESKRLLAGICLDIGLKSTSIPVVNEPRQVGSSHYSLLMRFDVFIDVLLLLSTRPLDYFFYMGTLVLVGSVVGLSYFIIVYFVKDVPPGFTSLLLLVTAFGSLLTMLLGVIGRYLANIYAEVRQRPLFHVDEVRNL